MYRQQLLASLRSEGIKTLHTSPDLLNKQQGLIFHLPLLLRGSGPNTSMCHNVSPLILLN